MNDIQIAVVQSGINNSPPDVIKNYSDGYHTFKELYDFRMMYNAALFNEWAKNGSEFEPFEMPKYDVHKSWRHHDNGLCFGSHDWFVVMALLPTGQISNHYKAEHWDLFKIPAAYNAKYEYDGHTPQDVLERLKAL